MMSTGAFAGLLIIGIILLFVGIMAVAYAPAADEATINAYTGIGVFGVLMIVGAIIYLMVQQAKAPAR